MVSSGRRALPPRITGYDHVGIRVSDGPAGARLSTRLGFIPDRGLFNERVAEIVAGTGPG